MGGCQLRLSCLTRRIDFFVSESCIIRTLTWRNETVKHRRPAVFALQTCTVHIISRHKHASLRMYESAILSVCRKSCVGLFRYAISAKKTSHLGRAPETFDELVEQIRFGHGEHVLFLWCAARIQNHQSVNGGIREPVNTLGMRMVTIDGCG